VAIAYNKEDKTGSPVGANDAALVQPNHLSGLGIHKMENLHTAQP